MTKKIESRKLWSPAHKESETRVFHETSVLRPEKYFIIVFSTGTCYSGVELMGDRLYHVTWVHGGWSQIEWCKYSLWCAYYDEITDNTFLRVFSPISDILPHIISKKRIVQIMTFQTFSLKSWRHFDCTSQKFQQSIFRKKANKKDKDPSL